MSQTLSDKINDYWKISDATRNDAMADVWRLLRAVKREIPVELPYAFVDGQTDPDLSIGWDVDKALKHAHATRNIYSTVRC